MFWLLLQKELHEHSISLRFSVAVLLCILLIPLAPYVNVKDYQKRLGSYTQSVQLCNLILFSAAHTAFQRYDVR